MNCFVKSWGLDQPLHVQYFTYMRRLLTGDLGVSFRWDRPVVELIAERLPATVQLSSFALVITGLIAFPIGVLSAVRKDSLFDVGGKMFAILGQSAPTFAVGLILMWFFAVQLDGSPHPAGRSEAYAAARFCAGLLQRGRDNAPYPLLNAGCAGSEYVKLAVSKAYRMENRLEALLRNALIGPLTYFSLIFRGAHHRLGGHRNRFRLAGPGPHGH